MVREFCRIGNFPISVITSSKIGRRKSRANQPKNSLKFKTLIKLPRVTGVFRMFGFTVLISAAAALVPSSSSRGDVAVSRRAVLASGPLLAAGPLLLAQPRAAFASPEAKQAALAKAAEREAAEAAVEAGRDADPLTRTLQVYRDRLAAAGPMLDNKEWDAVRKMTSKLLTVMTLRGYTGESVKARADSWKEAGQEKKADKILELRQALVININQLEVAIFAAQTNDKKKMLSSEELKTLLAGVVTGTDGLIGQMGCQLKEDGTERRWRSGACEILPMAPNLRDLAY